MSAASHHRQWSVAKFECERTHLCEFLKGPIQAIEQGKRRLLIRAPVKSGKRQMVEYLAMRDNASHQTRKHVFLTNWHRTADEENCDKTKLNQQSVNIWVQNIKGIEYFIDSSQNVYKHEDVINNSTNPRIIAKYSKSESGAFSIAFL